MDGTIIFTVTWLSCGCRLSRKQVMVWWYLAQPDTVWASKSGLYYNFDIGEARDDDGLELVMSIERWLLYVTLYLIEIYISSRQDQSLFLRFKTNHNPN